MSLQKQFQEVASVIIQKCLKDVNYYNSSENRQDTLDKMTIELKKLKESYRVMFGNLTDEQFNQMLNIKPSE